MVSVPDSGSSSPGSSHGWGHCVVFLGKTLLSKSLSSPRCINGCNELHVASHPGGVEIFLAASCYRNQDKLWPVGHLVRMQTLPLALRMRESI